MPGLSGYGRIEEGFELDGYSVILEKHGEKIIRYERKGRGEHVVRTIHGATRIELLPIYPVLLPSMITTYIQVKLENTVLVEPRGRTTIYVKIPVDHAIYVFSHIRYKVIDVFTPHKIKYILYGPTDRGWIARHVVSGIHMEKPGPSREEALVTVTINNRIDRWVEVGRILLDAQILKLYYAPGKWVSETQNIYFTITSPSTANIYYGGRPETDLKPIPDPVGLRPSRLLTKTEMLWGLV